MVSRIKKMLSKVCMFGLATSMSFGFGSFFASAVPNSSTGGTLIPDSIASEIALGINNTIENGRARLTFKNFIGKKLSYNNNDQVLIDKGRPSITLDNGKSGQSVATIDGDNNLPATSLVTWSNNSSPSSTTLMDLGVYDLKIWIRAIEQNSLDDYGGLKQNPNATDWVQIIGKNESGQDTSFANLDNLKRRGVGKYDFYYYVEGSPFGNEDDGNGKIIEDLVNVSP